MHCCRSVPRQINHLVQMANCPVLTDVSIDIEGVDECEIYPFPIPDLFLGAPIILSGKYQNAIFPSQVQLTGTLATGQPYAVKMPVTPAGSVPVERVFLKQRLELLTSKGWLQDSPEIMGQVVALSTAASMPCAHTTMIAFETTPQQLEKFQKKHGGAGAQNDGLFEADSSSGAAMGGRRGLSKGAIGALAVGGTIMVVGASAAAFGDVAATFGNVGAFACVACRITSSYRKCPFCFPAHFFFGLFCARLCLQGRSWWWAVWWWRRRRLRWRWRG